VRNRAGRFGHRRFRTTLDDIECLPELISDLGRPAFAAMQLQNPPMPGGDERKRDIMEVESEN
jgi:hypothetical protein